MNDNVVSLETYKEPIQKDPDGQSISFVTDAIGFEIPCWVEHKLYRKYNDGNELASILNAMSEGIRKAAATSAGDASVVHFKWWTFLDPRDRKRKPIKLRGSLQDNRGSLRESSLKSRPT